MSDNVLTLQTGKSDADRATEYRSKIDPRLRQVAQIMEEARRDGLNIAWNIGPNMYGTVMHQRTEIVKPLP